MASQTTLAELRARALDYADMTDSDFPVVARLDDYLNSAAADLYDVLVNSMEDYFLELYTFNIQAGTEAYDLPDGTFPPVPNQQPGFYKARKIFYLADNTRRFRVRRFNLDDVNAALIQPFSGGTIEMWYIPEMPLMVAATDTVAKAIPPIVHGWDDAIALGGAIKLLAREESDTSVLAAQQGRIMQRIMDMAEPRDEGEPDRIKLHRTIANPYDVFFGSGSFSYRYRIMGQKIRFLQYALGI